MVTLSTIILYLNCHFYKKRLKHVLKNLFYLEKLTETSTTENKTYIILLLYKFSVFVFYVWQDFVILSHTEWKVPYPYKMRPKWIFSLNTTCHIRNNLLVYFNQTEKYGNSYETKFTKLQYRSNCKHFT